MEPARNHHSSASASAFLSRDAAHREQRHRRAIVVAIGALIVFSTLPVFGHHVAGRAEALLLGRDHLGAVCLVALHMLLAPVHGVFHLLLITGVCYAVWNRIRAALRLHRLLRLLPSQRMSERGTFAVAAANAGLDTARLHVMTGLPVPAFTSGWLRPIVYVDAGLADRLTTDELAALLAHEAAHLARRDPLRLSLLRFLAHVLFWVPALRRIADDAADEMEIAADDHAARVAASFPSGAGRRGPLVLASAILALADARTGYGRRALRDVAAIGAVGFHRQDLLERRVRRLAGEEIAFGTHLTRRSVTGATAALAAVWISGLMMAHPLPAASSVLAHCEHHHTLAVMHLFCRGEETDGPCPHSGQ